MSCLDFYLIKNFFFLNIEIIFSCKQGWTGRYCTVEDNGRSECNLKCKNGGKCVFNEEKDKNVCDCSRTVFGGELCDEDEQRKTQPNEDTLCSSTYFCLNGGTCDNKRKCICAPGYTGERCQIKNVNKCGDNLKICLNDALCVINNENEHECQCRPYFTGKHCETSLNLCKTNNPCQSNGDTCVWNQLTATASCIYSKKIVEISSTLPTLSSSSSPLSSSLNTSQVIIVLTLGITLPILVILILVLILRVFRNREAMRTKANELSSSSCLSSTSSSDGSDVCKYEKNKNLTSTPTTLTTQSTAIKIINNNLFDAQMHNKQKIICVNNIKECLSSTSKAINSNSSHHVVSYDYNMMASIV